MCLQDEAKRSSACFTDEERAERGANAVCGTERSGRPLVL